MDSSNTYQQVKSMPLAFFGAADFSLTALESLIETGVDIGLVVTKPDTLSGRGRKATAPKVKTLALDHQIPVIQPSNPKELTEQLGDFNNIRCGIVVAYGMILPDTVLDHFQDGLINIHASLLPKWRGPSPIEAAILSDDKHTGVSIMQINERMDAGGVYGFTQVPLSPASTRPQLYSTLSQLGADTLIALLPGILSSDIEPIPQDEESATYCKLIKKSDGEIDWSRPSAQIERQIRAYLGWPGSFTTINGLRVEIEKATPTNLSGTPGQAIANDKDLIIYAGEGALLIKRLKPAGKKSISGQEFVRGYLK